MLNIIEECKKAGNPDMAYIFGSTSKITFPGAGVAFFGASRANVDFTAKQLSAQAISWDKLNMLRHVRFFQNLDGIKAQMDKHAAILRPKFDAVLSTLEAQLGGTGAGTWVKPKGGYFVTYIAMPGCAKRIVQLCREAGVEESKVFPHNLRHLFARTFYGLEKDIVRLADILVHSSVDTTRIYTMESGFTPRRQLAKRRLVI